MNALAHLLTPLPLERFHDRRDARPWCVVEGDLARLPEWLRDPALRDLAAWGRVFRGTGYVQRAAHAHPIDAHYPGGDARPELLYAMGLTQNFPSVQRFLPACDAWLASLCESFGVPAGMFHAHVFVSPPGEGLRWHFDACDTFVVQLRGAKRWRLAPNHHVQNPVGTSVAPGMRPAWQHLAQMPDALPDEDPPEHESLTLTEGSVLWLPRGVWHCTDASDEGSISVSLSSRIPTLAECLLRQLEAALLQDPALRAPAYGLTGDVAQRDALAAALDRGLARVPAIARALSGASVMAQATPGDAPVALTTRLYRDPSTRVTMTRALDDDDSLRVRTDVSALMLDARRGESGAFTCSSDAAPLVAWVDRRRGVFTAQAFADAFDDVDVESVLALLESMRDVGMVSVCAFPRVDVAALTS